MTVQIALFDLDGTLIDNISKASFKEGETFDWVKFMEASLDCCTFESTYNLMKEYQEKGIICMICTARPEHFEMLIAQDLINRKLGEDMLVMRDNTLWADELEALVGITDEDVIKATVHEHHAKYRKFIIEDLEEHYGKGCVVAAVDDQKRNLDTFLEYGVDCKLVTEGVITDYTGEA